MDKLYVVDLHVPTIQLATYDLPVKEKEEEEKVPVNVDPLPTCMNGHIRAIKYMNELENTTRLSLVIDQNYRDETDWPATGN